MGFFSPIFLYTASASTIIYTNSFGATLSSDGIINASTTSGADVWINTQTPDFVNNYSSGFRPFGGGSLYALGLGTSSFNLLTILDDYPTLTGLPVNFCMDMVGSYPTPCLQWVTITFSTFSISSSSSSPFITPLTPVSGSGSGENVSFTGTYNSDGSYSAIRGSFTDTTNGIVSNDFYLIPAISGTSLDYAFTQPLTANHNYSYTLSLYNSATGATSAETAPISFSTLPLGTLPTEAWVASSCTWIDFSTWGGCLTNLARDLFYPDSASLSQFNSLYTEYQNKPPFGYISAIQTSLKSLNDTNTSAFTLQSLPILNTYIFDPLRLALAWILWLAFAFVLFTRFKHIQL